MNKTAVASSPRVPDMDTDAASLTSALVTRVRLAGTGVSVADTIRVPLDSSFVFDATAYHQRPVGAGQGNFFLQPFDQVTAHGVPPSPVLASVRPAQAPRHTP